MKKTFFLFSLIITLLLSASCGAVIYRDDLSIGGLTEFVRDDLNHQIEYVRAAPDYLDDYFDLPDYVREHDIYYASDGNNLNEFGIFRVTEGNAEQLETKLNGYLKDTLEQNQAFYDSYIPQETPKLRDAEVRRFGNYVAYAILDKPSRKSFFSAVERGLTVK